ncbi:MAG: NAD(P)-dependent alcohol dehydrogenase [Williamsia sp.]|nr:NAD(P)-dependent alcohol dehydrogenase [Williamsia sp.]
MKVYATLGDGIEALQVKELPTPKVESEEVLVKMKSVSLNFRDLLVINGVASWKPVSQRIPVSAGVGEITSIGKNVSKWKVGDVVAGIFLPKWLEGNLTAEAYILPLGGPIADGVLAEYVVFNQQSIVKVPANLSNTEAATLPVAALTAWHAVARRSQVKDGETVLIQGTGGVSLFALQFAKAMGGKIIALSSSDEKLERVKALGASNTINYKKHADWDKKVLDLTDGRGVEHVIEVVGGENLNRSLNAVKIGGTISFIGLMAGLSAPINTYQFVSKNIRIHGIETGSRKMFEEMNRFIELHGINPVIDRVFSFIQIKDALKYLESGSHFGKVIIDF